MTDPPPPLSTSPFTFSTTDNSDGRTNFERPVAYDDTEAYAEEIETYYHVNSRNVDSDYAPPDVNNLSSNDDDDDVNSNSKPKKVYYQIAGMVLLPLLLYAGYTLGAKTSSQKIASAVAVANVTISNDPMSKTPKAKTPKTTGAGGPIAKQDKKRRDSNDRDVCLEWNAIAITSNIFDHKGKAKSAQDLSLTMGPVASARAFAMMHTAMFEAYNCEKKTHDNSYPAGHPIHKINCTGVSTLCTVAQAVHDVMCGVKGEDDIIGLFEEDQDDQDICDMADTALRNALSREEDKDKCKKGTEAGRDIAKYVLMERANDGYGTENRTLKDEMYVPPSGNNPGYHMPDAENPEQGVLGAGFGKVKAFFLTREELMQFSGEDAPGVTVNERTGEVKFDLNDTEYLAALMEVRELGVFRGGTSGEYAPTDDETVVIGQYWSADGSPHIGTPIALLNDMTRKIVMEVDIDEKQSCYLFPLLSVVMGNVAIAVWHKKFNNNLWRPLLAISSSFPESAWARMGASRANPFDNETNFDPPFPSFPSGHAAFCCATFQTIANVYQTHNITFNYTSPEVNGETYDQFNRKRKCIIREFPTLKHAMAECAASRVFNGVHYSFDGDGGCKVGIDIANYVYENKFLPLDGSQKTSMPDMREEIFDEMKKYLNNTATSGYSPNFCSKAPEYPLPQP